MRTLTAINAATNRTETQLTPAEHELAEATNAYFSTWLETFEAAGRESGGEEDPLAYCTALADKATREQGIVLDRLRARQLVTVTTTKEK